MGDVVPSSSSSSPPTPFSMPMMVCLFYFTLFRCIFSEYGVYLTRKSECALLRREATTYPIALAGDPAIGVIKLPHTHEIPTSQP